MPPVDSPGRWATVGLLLLVLIPSAFNAIMLLSELSLPVPSLNDDAFHYLFIQRASEAVAGGENPFDHWAPELELGFPQFFYYQHLPHLAVILLHRLLLKQVDLFTLFNLDRYLLLLGFPLTVYWSMRRLGFSVVPASVAAANATLLSANHHYGFEYDSYVWRGFGMYTQLWAMHLSFITLACRHRLLERGTGLHRGHRRLLHAGPVASGVRLLDGGDRGQQLGALHQSRRESLSRLQHHHHETARAQENETRHLRLTSEAPRTSHFARISSVYSLTSVQRIRRKRSSTTARQLPA
jgi:hypothetical protein